MVIEVDGDIHLSQEAKNYDENRTEELKRFGITILRFKNYDVLNDVEKVITEIKNKIKDLASPAHLGAGDGRG
jgi:very-short-patch-repair endonuclease